MVKGYKHDNSKSFSSRSPNWPERPFESTPPRMSRNAPKAPGGKGASSLPPHSGPTRMSRDAPKSGGAAKANALPPNTTGYVNGVDAGTGRKTYGV